MSENTDPCACYFNNELVMRRLLSFLRQSQNVCADNECFDSLPTLPAPENSGMIGDNGLFTYALMWMAVAFILYVLRPGSLRSVKGAFSRSSEGDNNDDGAGPSGNSPGVY